MESSGGSIFVSLEYMHPAYELYVLHCHQSLKFQRRLRNVRLLDGTTIQTCFLVTVRKNPDDYRRDRQLRERGPEALRIFSRDEKKQDDMRHEYQAKFPDVAGKIRFYIGDVRSLESVRSAMPGTDYIFHAAALKQVPSCEFFPMGTFRCGLTN